MLQLGHNPHLLCDNCSRSITDCPIGLERCLTEACLTIGMSGSAGDHGDFELLVYHAD
jgi:hypothetical protein